MAKAARDIEGSYSLPDFIDKLRRLANALETGKRFDIQIAEERIYVPVRATYTIEHERSGEDEEIEFQIKWEHDAGAEKEEDDETKDEPE